MLFREIKIAGVCTCVHWKQAYTVPWKAGHSKDCLAEVKKAS